MTSFEIPATTVGEEGFCISLRASSNGLASALSWIRRKLISPSISSESRCELDPL